MAEAECRVHKLVADVAVLAGGKVLMVKYRDTSRYDHQSGWFLPDDFLLHLEHPDDAARRILQEQIGIPVSAVWLHHIESFGNGAWHLVFHYKYQASVAPAAVAGPNVIKAEWFSLDRLPDPADVAHHGWALDVLAKLLK